MIVVSSLVLTMYVSTLRHSSVEVVRRPSPDEVSISEKTGAELHARTLVVQTHDASGDPRQWDLLIVWAKGWYWWHWQRERIAVVEPYPGPAIRMSISVAAAATLDEAERAILAAIAAHPERLHQSPSRLVPLDAELGRTFGANEGMAETPSAVVERVRRAAGQWTIVLRGFTGERAEVVLSDESGVIQARRLR